ncbi:hypothetical protein CMO91_01925 [Candidatus Woesearchaeota archaeon]|nr:hypothetical protein [Candidatus Woesearchaeota archaeon]
MSDIPSIESLMGEFDSSNIITTKDRNPARINYVRYRELKSLQHEFVGSGPQEHPFFDRLGPAQKFRIAMVAEGLEDYDTAILVHHNINGDESMGALFLEWLANDESVEVLAERASPEMCHYLAKSVHFKTEKDPMPIYDKWRKHHQARGDHFRAARVGYKAERFDWIVDSVIMFQDVEWPQFAQRTESGIKQLKLEGWTEVAECKFAFGKTPLGAAKEIVTWARTAKARGSERYLDIYEAARVMLSYCNQHGAEGRVCTEMQDFETAFDLLDKATSWYSAALLYRKVDRPKATIEKIRRRAVEKYYLEELVLVPGDDMYGHLLHSEDAANRLYQQKFYHKLLMDDYRWQEAARYANLHDLDNDYAQQCTDLRDRMQNIRLGLCWANRHFVQQYIPLAAMSWLVSLPEERLNPFMDGLNEHLRGTQKHVEEVWRYIEEHKDETPAPLEERDMAAVLLNEWFGTNDDRGLSPPQVDLREHADVMQCLAKIAETRPRYACYQAAKHFKTETAPNSWIARTRRRFNERRVGWHKFIEMDSVYDGAERWQTWEYEYRPTSKRATAGIPLIYGIKTAEEIWRDEPEPY